MKKITQALSVLSVVALAIAALPSGSAFAIGDLEPPITSAVVVSPDPAALNDTVTVTATVDDSTTGNSNIQSAEFSVNGGTFTAMTASDGTFDTPTEDVTGTFTATQQGTNQVCVRGTDADGNVGDATCADSTAQSIYTFTGFLPPIKMAGMHPRAGRTIPVKWKLTLTADGSPVIDPAFFVGVESYSVDCITQVGDPSTAVVETSPGVTGLHHRGISKWRFNWKTPKSYAGSCRMMFLLLSDGSMSPTVFFKFR